MDDLDDLDGVADLKFHDDDETPVTPFPCGMEVSGERVGHCSGPADGFDGCCRNFYGIKSWDKHHVIGRGATSTRRCRTDAELIGMGFVNDGPSNSWRLATVAVVEGSKEDAE